MFTVRHSKGQGGHIVFLKLMDDTNKVVPVYVGMGRGLLVLCFLL